MWLNPALASDVDDPPPIMIRGTSSPFQPPEADDRTFVINDDPMLDTGCSYRSDGPLVFNIPVTRYAGPTNADGTLQNAATLVQMGLICRYATLIMPAYDVDFDAVTVPPEQPERDRVFFNGEPTEVLVITNDQYLQGAGGIWRLNSFQIPIEKIKFPNAPGTGGNAPTPAENEIRIEIDVANDFPPYFPEEWCTAIDWAVLDIKIMSPIILIHGTNSEPEFFVRQGFTSGLDEQFLLFDNSITLPTNSRAANGARLHTLIPNIVTNYGVDSVHLVAHSKGGLDAREYLEHFQPEHDDDFRILSLTTLSTPHNGSVLADVVVTRAIAARHANRIYFQGFPGMANALAFLGGIGGPASDRIDLQTAECLRFNRRNLRALPREVVYSTVAGDADCNSNTVIDYNEYQELMDECPALAWLHFDSPPAARDAVTAVYLMLRNSAGVSVAFQSRLISSPVGDLRGIVATLTSVPNPTPLGNDTLVTVPSGHGFGGIGGLVTNRLDLVPARPGCANHSDIAATYVAHNVGPWVIATERAIGDLKQ